MIMVNPTDDTHGSGAPDHPRGSLADAVHVVLRADGSSRPTGATALPGSDVLDRLRKPGIDSALAPSAKDQCPAGAADVGHLEARSGSQEAGRSLDRRLQPCDPMLDLARRYLAEQLDELRRLAPGTDGSKAPEAVHQMRVAMRRIRAALKAFGPLFPQHSSHELRQEFRWLAQCLGRVRDLDVYRARLHHQIAALAAEQTRALAPYEAHLAREHETARREMLAALGSSRCRQLFEQFASFVHREPSRAESRRWGSLRICDGAPIYVDAACRRVRKRGRRIEAESPPQELHELRIRAKRLRYLMEIFGPVYGKRLRKCIKAVRCLQDTLGEHQDACVANAQLRAYADSLVPGKRSTSQLLALGSLMHVQAESAADARGRFADDWRRFEGKCRPSQLRQILAAGCEDRRS